MDYLFNNNNLNNSILIDIQNIITLLRIINSINIISYINKIKEISERGKYNLDKLNNSAYF